jgi:peroxiredoxin
MFVGFFEFSSSVNDAFVMKGWAENLKAGNKINFLADWDGAFTKSIGLLITIN